MAAAALFGIEIARLGWAGSSAGAIARGEPSARRDLRSYALDVTGLLRAAGHLLTLGAGYWVGAGVRRALDLQLVGAIAAPGVALAVFLLAKSFFDDWMHRAMHRVPALWELHKYHHSAEEMNVLTAHRESVLVGPLVTLFFALPFGVLGVSPPVFWGVRLAIELHAMLIHSRLHFGFGWLDALFISPAAHRLHHARYPQGNGANYGFIVSVWDRVFGTWQRPERVPGPIGVECDVYNRRPYWAEMAHSVRASARALRGFSS